MPDASSVDAPIDAVSGPPFVGRWRDLDKSIPESQRAVATFGADGTYTLMKQGSTQTGSWTVDRSGELTLSLGPYVTTAPYYVTSDRLATATMEPVGEVDGIIGEWEGPATATGTRIVSNLVFRADGTQTFTRSYEGTMTVWEGTYTYMPERSYIFMTFTSPGAPQNAVYVRTIPDVVIADQVFERLPD